MKKLLNLILSLLHSVEWLIIVSLFWKLLLYLHSLKFEFHKHVPSNCKTLSDLFYTNRPHLSKAGMQGEKIERFWTCSRRRPRCELAVEVRCGDGVALAGLVVAKLGVSAVPGDRCGGSNDVRVEVTSELGWVWMFWNGFGGVGER